MISPKSFPEVEDRIRNTDLVFLYLSQAQCSVCQSLLPKVDDLLSTYPKISSFYINTANLQFAAGQLSVFSIPTVILFVQGKEYFRLVRTFGLSEIRDRIERIYEHF